MLVVAMRGSMPRNGRCGLLHALPREHIAESSWLQTFATGMTTHAHTHTPIQTQRSCLILWWLVPLKLLLTRYTGVTSSLSVPWTSMVEHEDCQRAAATLTARKNRESVMQMMLFIMSCCLLKYPVFWVIYAWFCPGQDEWASCHSSGCIRGAMATGGAGLGLIQWSEKAWCFYTCRGYVGVCDVRWSASTGWPSMRSCSDYHACRHGVISCVNALHVKTWFPLQGTLFYDMGERYIDEDDEKLVLLPQARDRELEPPCLMHMAPVGPADAFQLDRCHEACPWTRLEGQGSGRWRVCAHTCWMCCIRLHCLPGPLGSASRPVPGGVSSLLGAAASTGVVGTALRGRAW